MSSHSTSHSLELVDPASTVGDQIDSLPFGGISRTNIKFDINTIDISVQNDHIFAIGGIFEDRVVTIDKMLDPKNIAYFLPAEGIRDEQGNLIPEIQIIDEQYFQFFDQTKLDMKKRSEFYRTCSLSLQQIMTIWPKMLKLKEGVGIKLGVDQIITKLNTRFYRKTNGEILGYLVTRCRNMEKFFPAVTLLDGTTLPGLGEQFLLDLIDFSYMDAVTKAEVQDFIKSTWLNGSAARFLGTINANFGDKYETSVYRTNEINDRSIFNLNTNSKIVKFLQKFAEIADILYKTDNSKRRANTRPGFNNFLKKKFVLDQVQTLSHLTYYLALNRHISSFGRDTLVFSGSQNMKNILLGKDAEHYRNLKLTEFTSMLNLQEFLVELFTVVDPYSSIEYFNLWNEAAAHNQFLDSQGWKFWNSKIEVPWTNYAGVRNTIAGGLRELKFLGKYHGGGGKEIFYRLQRNSDGSISTDASGNMIIDTTSELRSIGIDERKFNREAFGTRMETTPNGISIYGIDGQHNILALFSDDLLHSSGQLKKTRIMAAMNQLWSLHNYQVVLTRKKLVYPDFVTQIGSTVDISVLLMGEYLDEVLDWYTGQKDEDFRGYLQSGAAGIAICHDDGLRAHHYRHYMINSDVIGHWIPLLKESWGYAFLDCIKNMSAINTILKDSASIYESMSVFQMVLLSLYKDHIIYRIDPNMALKIQEAFGIAVNQEGEGQLAYHLITQDGYHVDTRWFWYNLLNYRNPLQNLPLTAEFAKFATHRPATNAPNIFFYYWQEFFFRN